MRLARLRLVVAVCLFGGWLSYLAYLAATTRNPVVLSRPQFLVSSFDVVAQVDRPDGQPPSVTVRQVLWPAGDKARALEGLTVKVTNLADATGWDKPGAYILALQSEKDTFRVAPTPVSPGFHPLRGASPPIYPLTGDTLHQLSLIIHAKESAMAAPDVLR